MIFGPIPVATAAGTLLAHSVRLRQRTLKKGRLLSAADIEALKAEGVATVTAVRFEPGEVTEDIAAERIALAVKGPGIRVNAPFTGRVNMFAEKAGVLVMDRERLNRINLVDESVTVATLEPFVRVSDEQMVATIKIIPFAAPEAVLRRVEAIARIGDPLVRCEPFRRMRVALIQSTLPGIKTTVLDKTVDVTRERLSSLGAHLSGERRCDHTAEAIAFALKASMADVPDFVLITGATAIVDRQDALPAGIVAAGGEVIHFGMPVDPGNLILMGEFRGRPVVGLPGCARSPKLNGFDWVLARLCAGVQVGQQEIMRMGAGGLLAEIPSRGHPRATQPDGTAQEAPRASRIAGLVLAGGRSSRMGEQNKLLLDVDGKTMLAHVLDTVAASDCCATVAVTGHETDLVSPLLAGRDLLAVHNPDYARGLSTSLKAGLRGLPKEIDGVLVCLGDMPKVTARHLNQLIESAGGQGDYSPDLRW